MSAGTQQANVFVPKPSISIVRAFTKHQFGCPVLHFVAYYSVYARKRYPGVAKRGYQLKLMLLEERRYVGK